MVSVTASTRPRLVSAPFVVVTCSTLALFTFVGMAVTVLPRFIEDELGGDGLAIGVNLAVFALAAIAVRPLIGHIGDRAGRRVLMVGGALLAGASIAATAAVQSIYTLLPLRALSGIGEAALFVGAATLISDLSPANRRAEGASYFSLAVFGGIGVGSVVGDVLLADGRFALVFVVAASCCAAAAVIALFAPNRVAGVARAAMDEHRPGFHRSAVLPGLVLACGIGGFAAFNAFLPTYADDIGIAASGPFALYSVLCLALRLFGARLPERMGLANAVTGAFLALSAGLLILAVIGNAGGAYLGTVVLSLGVALLYPSLMAYTVNSVPEAERAMALATFTMFFEVGVVAGGLLLGPVAEVAGERGAFAGGALIAGLGIWVLRRRLLPAAHRQEAAAQAQPVRPPVFDGGLAAGD